MHNFVRYKPSSRAVLGRTKKGKNKECVQALLRLVLAEETVGVITKGHCGIKQTSEVSSREHFQK